MPIAKASHALIAADVTADTRKLYDNAGFAAGVADSDNPLKAFIETRLAEIEDKIARAQVIDVSKLSGKQIKFGATVNLLDEDSGEKSKYKIVGEDESDVKAGKISISSPMARALIGKEEGDVVEVMAPGGPKSYEVVKVKF